MFSGESTASDQKNRGRSSRVVNYSALIYDMVIVVFGKKSKSPQLSEIYGRPGCKFSKLSIREECRKDVKM